MELLDSSMDKIADKVYNKLNETIPENILGKITVSVSVKRVTLCCLTYIRILSFPNSGQRDSS